MNLGKLVPLEVHGRVENTKIAKKYFLMSEWGMPYNIGKLKRRVFQQAKEHAHRIPGQGDMDPGSPGSVPERPPRPKGGGSCRGL